MPLPSPKIGEIKSGYRFKGGDPRSQSAWEPVSQALAPMNQNAMGARYLPPKYEAPSKSEEAYYREWRTKDPQASNTSVGQARAAVGTDRRAESLLARQKTGGIYGVPIVGNIAGWLDPEVRELDAIQARVARQERQPGEGAISDFDAQQFLAMSYGKDKPTATNQALIRARREANDSVIQRRQFGEWYQSRFGKMNGFEEAWDRYSQDNPIFSNNASAERPVLNPARQTWRAYFGAGGDARPTSAAGGQPRQNQAVKPVKQLSNAELLAIAGLK